jgi:hypothetical protein
VLTRDEARRIAANFAKLPGAIAALGPHIVTGMVAQFKCWITFTALIQVKTTEANRFRNNQGHTAMKTIAIIVLTLSAISSALSYDRKFIHPECTEENGVRHCEVPPEEGTPNTPIKPHEQLSPQAPQINSDVPDYPQRDTNDVRKLQFPKDLQFHYDNRSLTINFGPYHLYMQAR